MVHKGMILKPKIAGIDKQLHRRADERDVLDAILPFNRRDQLAGLLTDDDIATVKHLAKEGMGKNALPALALILDNWRRGQGLQPVFLCPGAAPEAMLLTFVAHHLS